MIESIILNHLLSVLSVPVYMEVPETPEKKFVVVEKTGSGVKNKIHSAMLVVQSYAPTLFTAAELNEAVKAAMETADELDEICSVKLNTDYNFTDTSTKRYRYQAVYDIVHY